MQYRFIKVKEASEPKSISPYFEEVNGATYDLTLEGDVKSVFNYLKVQGENFGITVKDSDANALIDILANLNGDQVSEETILEQFKDYFEL